MWPWLPAAVGVVAAGAGVAALRRAWSQAGPARPWCIVAGWGLIGLGLMAACCGPWRADKALAVGALAVSCVAGVLVTQGLERRSRKRKRPKTEALDPIRRPVRPWRAALRVLYVGPLSGAVAIGVCLLIALRTPMSPIDRLIFGGLAGPAVWAVAAIWSLTDERVGRIALGLGGAAALSIGIALWL